jgi:hypothetical protein
MRPDQTSALRVAAPSAAGERAFGAPIVSRHRTIIPLASVLISHGGDGEYQRVLRTRQVGVIELNADGVHIRFAPSVALRLGVIATLLVGWTLGWAVYLARTSASDKPVPPLMRTSQ